MNLNSFNLILLVFVALSFLFYGFNCLNSNFLKEEFERFGLSKFRVLTGILQLAGAIGLLLGILFPWVGLIAASGLTLLMLMGFLTRLKVKDNFQQSAPSAVFALLNFYMITSFL